MLRSLIEYTIKPHGHEDAEKELAEVMDLCSKYPLYVAESEKSEYDRHVFKIVKFSLFIDDR
jgi:hypothetical protein